MPERWVFLCSDLTESTLAGATLSLIAALSIVLLLGMVGERRSIGSLLKKLQPSSRLVETIWHVDMSLPVLQELNAFLTPDLESQMVVDRSAHGELLRINFNISFPSLPCEFASLDVSDALGTVLPSVRLKS